MSKRKVNLRGPKFVSEMRNYKCPFTAETKLFHPAQWPLYLQEKAKDHTLQEIVFAYKELADSTGKETLERLMLHYHNSVVQ